MNLSKGMYSAKEPATPSINAEVKVQSPEILSH